MMSSVVDRILGLHGWVAALVVFAIPALEASAFVGFVFPGEIAVLLGGVLAYQHRIALSTALIAAVAGAVIGDTIGYEIGKRYGHQLIDRTVGRVMRRSQRHVEHAKRYLAERGGKAVFLGRFTAALRVLIPGLAGMSGMPYRRFLAYNAAGGALWAGGFVLAGYAAGGSWRRVEHVAGRASLLLLLFAVLVAAVVASTRWAATHHDRVVAVLDRPWIRRVRTLLPSDARGRTLIAGFGVLIAAGWAFGAITQDVIAGEESARLDQPVLEWFVRHREPWLTTTLRVLTVLGSSNVIVPVALVIGLVLVARRRTLVPLVYLARTYVGAEVLFHAVKQLTRRRRPPASLAALHLHFSGYAFPSGHATMATAMWGALAVTVGVHASWRWRTVLAAVAVLVAIVVGVSRMYLGAHWFTDVAAGWTLGALWLTVTTLAYRPPTPATPATP